MKRKKLGELLIEQGRISEEHLEWALAEQRGKEVFTRRSSTLPGFDLKA
jgi:hypothetical protein